ncbi:hypothetical protein ABZ362_20895 [Streptomyces sp. NPDC005951]
MGRLLVPRTVPGVVVGAVTRVFAVPGPSALGVLALGAGGLYAVQLLR